MIGRTRCELETCPCTWIDPEPPQASSFLTQNFGGRAQPLCQPTPQRKSPLPLQLQNIFRAPIHCQQHNEPPGTISGGKAIKIAALVAAWVALAWATASARFGASGHRQVGQGLTLLLMSLGVNNRLVLPRVQRIIKLKKKKKRIKAPVKLGVKFIYKPSMK